MAKILVTFQKANCLDWIKRGIIRKVSGVGVPNTFSAYNRASKCKVFGSSLYPTLLA